MFAITRTRSPLAELQGLNRLVDEPFRNWPGLTQALLVQLRDQVAGLPEYQARGARKKGAGRRKKG